MKKIILAAMFLVPTLALANPGYYIQGEVGPSMDPFPGGGIGINVGHLWGGDNFNYGLEAGLSGNAGVIFAFIPTTGIDISALGIAKYTFDCGFLVLGKAGLGILNQSVGPISISSVGPKVELGLGYQFNPTWEMDLTAEATAATVFGEAVTNDDGTHNFTYSGGLFLGLTHHFA